MKTRTLIAGLTAALVAAALSGCSLFQDPVKEMADRIGAPIQVTARASFPAGELIFFRFVKGTECGEGVIHASGIRGGGSGWGSGPCGGPPAPLSMGGSFSDGAYAVVYGQVNDPQIKAVKVLFEGEKQEREATVENGIWYLYLPGQGGTAPSREVIGYGADGAELLRVP